MLKRFIVAGTLMLSLSSHAGYGNLLVSVNQLTAKVSALANKYRMEGPLEGVWTKNSIDSADGLILQTNMVFEAPRNTGGAAVRNFTLGFRTNLVRSSASREGILFFGINRITAYSSEAEFIAYLKDVVGLALKSINVKKPITPVQVSRNYGPWEDSLLCKLELGDMTSQQIDTVLTTIDVAIERFRLFGIAAARSSAGLE